MTHDQDETDVILDVTRCVRCGHRLEGEIECPFCSLFQEATRSNGLQKWIYITACFLTSPLSVYYVFKSNRSNTIEKVLTFSGCLFWFALYFAVIDCVSSQGFSGFNFCLDSTLLISAQMWSVQPELKNIL